MLVQVTAHLDRVSDGMSQGDFRAFIRMPHITNQGVALFSCTAFGAF